MCISGSKDLVILFTILTVCIVIECFVVFTITTAGAWAGVVFDEDDDGGVEWWGNCAAARRRGKLLKNSLAAFPLCPTVSFYSNHLSKKNRHEQI